MPTVQSWNPSTNPTLVCLRHRGIVWSQLGWSCSDVFCCVSALREWTQTTLSISVISQNDEKHITFLLFPLWSHTAVSSSVGVLNWCSHAPSVEVIKGCLKELSPHYAPHICWGFCGIHFSAWSSVVFLPCSQALWLLFKITQRSKLRSCIKILLNECFFKHTNLAEGNSLSWTYTAMYRKRGEWS